MPTCSTPNLQPRNTHSACSFTSDVFQICVPTRPLSAPTCQTSRRQNKCAKRSTGEDKVHEAQYEPWHWNWKCRQELSNDPSPTYESIQAVHSLRFHYDLLVITLQDSDSFLSASFRLQQKVAHKSFCGFKLFRLQKSFFKSDTLGIEHQLLLKNLCYVEE